MDVQWTPRYRVCAGSTVKAELKRLHSPDADDLAELVPEDPARFAVLVQAMIGPLGGAGEESFDIVVCSPRWVEEQLSSVPVFFPRHHLVMKQYDYSSIHTYISEFCDSCDGPDWKAIAVKLSRLGHWEFEDYVE